MVIACVNGPSVAPCDTFSVTTLNARISGTIWIGIGADSAVLPLVSIIATCNVAVPATDGIVAFNANGAAALLATTVPFSSRSTSRIGTVSVTDTPTVMGASA